MRRGFEMNDINANDIAMIEFIRPFHGMSINSNEFYDFLNEWFVNDAGHRFAMVVKEASGIYVYGWNRDLVRQHLAQFAIRLIRPKGKGEWVYYPLSKVKELSPFVISE